MFSKAPWAGNGPFGRFEFGSGHFGSGFPADLALLYAPKKQADAFKSLKGAPPTFSYTGPQYDADGVSVGAVPAYHAGKGVWVGPSYTQMLQNSKFVGAVSGSPGTAPTNWTDVQSGGSLEVVDGGLRLYGTGLRRVLGETVSVAANTKYYFAAYVLCDGVLPINQLLLATGAPSGSAIAHFVDGNSFPSVSVPAAGWRELGIELSVSSTAGAATFRIGVGCNGAFTGAASITITHAMLTTLRNAPCVATGPNETITAPSAAGTSGGNGLAWAKDAKTGAIYDGQGTVACKVAMGIASSGVAADSNILTVDDSVVGLIYAASDNKLKSNEGTNTAEVSCTWAANDELLIVVELLASTFRIGFAKAADSAITWGTAAAYDGSHNSGTHLRAALLNTLPMWGKGIYVSSATGLPLADLRRYI